MAGTNQGPEIQAKARKYLLGPCNHTGTGYTNEQVRNPIWNSAEVICLQGPPGVDVTRVRHRLVPDMNLHFTTVGNAYNEEFDDPDSPYPQYLMSQTINSAQLPDKMKVELLGKYLERRILDGQTRFLVEGMPDSEKMAAIFEEDVCLIRAYIYVDGPRTSTVSRDQYDRFVAANRPIRQKLQAEGRYFELDSTASPRAQDAAITQVENTISSIGYLARLMNATDVFRPPPPPTTSLSNPLVPPPSTT
ncbi:MAG: hypothetical protein Q9184_006539 [Pyrenodesmia sp. 2 TL-2023]